MLKKQKFILCFKVQDKQNDIILWHSMIVYH